MSKKDPSFDDYLDQQIDEHAEPELECGCTGVVTWPFGDHYCGKEYEEEEDCSHLEEDADDIPWGHKNYPSLRHFNPLTIMLEEENDL